MPGMDLSTLNSDQLRNILEVARSRNQQDLTDEVLSELKARRSRAPGQTRWRVFEGEGDAADQQPEVWWDGLRQEAEAPDAPPSDGRAGAILGVVAAVVLSAGLGWWLSRSDNPRLAEPATVAALPTPAPAVPAPRAMEARAEVPSPAGRAPRVVAAPPPPERLDRPSAVVVARPTTPIRLAKATTAAPSRSSSAKADTAGSTRSPPKDDAAAAAAPSCRGLATAADRMVCADPALTDQHNRMLAAYGRAIRAGVDQQLIDHDQAEWRDVRDRVKDPAKLANLYNRRIRELDAAARAADDDPPI